MILRGRRFFLVAERTHYDALGLEDAQASWRAWPRALETAFLQAADPDKLDEVGGGRLVDLGRGEGGVEAEVEQGSLGAFEEIGEGLAGEGLAGFRVMPQPTAGRGLSILQNNPGRISHFPIMASPFSCFQGKITGFARHCPELSVDSQTSPEGSNHRTTRRGHGRADGGVRFPIAFIPVPVWIRSSGLAPSPATRATGSLCPRP